MESFLSYYGLDLLAVALALYALVAAERAGRGAGLALLLAHAAWLGSGAPWVHVLAVVLVDAVFAARYYRARRHRRYVARQFATRRLSRSAQGLDVLC